ncbi:MAG: hypothetical protein ABFR36_09825 [Acidobacteriota bacterium]
MKRTTAGLIFFILLFSTAISGKDKLKYFRMDKIVTVSGKIVKIRSEERYRKNRFIVFELKENKTEKLYDVEVSPLWFYKIDVVEGGLIEVKGSLNNLKDKDVILAQSMTFAGEIFNFRDKFGFPLWRGERRGLGKNQWKGEMRKKGKK